MLCLCRRPGLCHPIGSPLMTLSSMVPSFLSQHHGFSCSSTLKHLHPQTHPLSHTPALHSPLPSHGRCTASTSLSVSLPVSAGPLQPCTAPLPPFLTHPSHYLPPSTKGHPCSLPSYEAVCLVFLHSPSPVCLLFHSHFLPHK